MNELNGVPDHDIHTFMMIREAICEGVCGKGRTCCHMPCLEYMLRQASEIVRVNELPDRS